VVVKLSILTLTLECRAMDRIKETRKAIDHLTQAQWQGIWSQGGTFRSFNHSPDHAYIGCTVIQTSSGLFRLGARTIETQGKEYFEMDIYPIASIGTNESEKMFIPPRRLVMTFPEDLAIEQFFGQVEKRYRLLTEKVGDVGEILDGVLFESGDTKLLFFVDPDIPESVLVTTSPNIREEQQHP